MPCYSGNSDDAELASRVGDACLPILKQAGLKIRDCLACGMEGCVFSLSNGKVAKITARVAEPRFTAHLASLDESHPSLPQIDSVWKLPDICLFESGAIDSGEYKKLGNWARGLSKQDYEFDEEGHPIFWMIIREDLADFPGNTGYLWSVIGPTRDYASGYIDKDELELQIDRAIDEVSLEYPDDYKKQKNIMDLGDLSLWMAENGMKISDIHDANLGWRPAKTGDDEGKLVIRDLGFSEIKDKKGKWKTVVSPVFEE